MRARVERWAAWAPGLESAEDWAAWARHPVPLEPKGHPEARFLPAMLRRRCSPLSRTLLTVAFGACPEDLQGEVRTVFASRHGSVQESIVLVEALVQREKISAAKFSHTVHNAQASLFSIAATNPSASSSLAAQGDTFSAGYLEALCHLERDPLRPVLLVVGDMELPEQFQHLVSEPAGVYGLALLLVATEESPYLELDVTPGPPEPLAWPDACEFLRFLLTDAPELTLGIEGRRWHWTRG